MNENEKLSRGLTDQSLADMNLARKLGLLPLSPDMIEKDILVADAIRAICAAGKARDAQIIFGGGTSLSQAQQVIQRMSEDADFRIVLPSDITSQNQRRKFLSAIKTDIHSAMEQAGFPLGGELKSRNGNAYIMGNFGYAPKFARSEALRPQIKLEITAFEPVANVELKPLRTILDRVLDRPIDTTLPMVPVVSLEDTLSDKVVGYLRRTAANRAGCGRGDYDDRLVRHLYDVHCILQAKGDLSGVVAPLFAGTVERDRETYGNQFPAFKDHPYAVLQDEITHLADPDIRARYERFCQIMIYGDIPAFDAVVGSFQSFADKLLMGMPKRGSKNSIASHEVPTSKQGANEGGTFTSHLYQVNECLDLLKVARKVKKMTAFYQTCDQLGEVSQAVAYARNAINHEPEQARIIEKLCDTACTARNHLESAYQALAQLDEPAKRDHRVDRFLDLVKQFEPETRMLPQSDVSDKSIWSDIHNLMEKCEALQQCQTVSNSVSTAGTNKAIRSQRIKKP